MSILFSVFLDTCSLTHGEWYIEVNYILNISSNGRAHSLAELLTKVRSRCFTDVLRF